MSGKGIAPLLKRLSKFARSSEESMQCMNRYATLMREPDGDIKFLHDTLVLLQGLAAETVLSDKFTNLPKEDKDLEQRVLKSVMDLCDFLLNPAKHAQQNVITAGANSGLKLVQQGDSDGKRKRPEGAM